MVTRFCHSPSFQPQQFHILVPPIAAVVLEADVAFARMILVDDVEFVVGAVRAFVGGGPLIEIRSSNLDVVHFDSDQVLIAGDFQVVPFALWFHRVLRRLHKIVESPSVVEVVGCCVVDGNFESVEAHILAFSRLQRKRTNEDAAVALGTNFEVQRQREVVVNLFVDQHVVAGMGIQGAVRHVGCINRLFFGVEPAVGGLAIEQQDPTVGFFGGGEFIVSGACEGRGNEQENHDRGESQTARRRSDGCTVGPSLRRRDSELFALVHSDHPFRYSV